ncbi:MAG: hypothetical protein FWF37_01885 [Chloroflexi bacterium]|nr:hypothetical protein [Chloroflexota bacterium]
MENFDALADQLLESIKEELPLNDKLAKKVKNLLADAMKNSKEVSRRAEKVVASADELNKELSFSFNRATAEAEKAQENARLSVTATNEEFIRSKEQLAKILSETQQASALLAREYESLTAQTIAGTDSIKAEIEASLIKAKENTAETDRVNALCIQKSVEVTAAVNDLYNRLDVVEKNHQDSVTRAASEVTIVQQRLVSMENNTFDMEQQVKTQTNEVLEKSQHIIARAEGVMDTAQNGYKTAEDNAGNAIRTAIEARDIFIAREKEVVVVSEEAKKQATEAMGQANRTGALVNEKLIAAGEHSAQAITTMKEWAVKIEASLKQAEAMSEATQKLADQVTASCQAALDRSEKLSLQAVASAERAKNAADLAINAANEAAATAANNWIKVFSHLLDGADNIKTVDLAAVLKAKEALENPDALKTSNRVEINQPKTSLLDAMPGVGASDNGYDQDESESGLVSRKPTKVKMDALAQMFARSDGREDENI